MTVHTFTSFSYSYLDRARVLARSIREVHPDWVIWAVLTDKAPPGFALDWEREDFDHVVTAEDLFGSATDSWLFGHDVVEACTAVKGRALQRILETPGAEKVFYFDPDIVLFNPVTSIETLLDTYAIVLTPHQLEPEASTDARAVMDNEITSLSHGAFNLGFVAVRNDGEGRRFADWWADRLQYWCHDRRDIGLFVDQKWCDLVPCLFDDVKVLRDPGCNVASWNLSRRTVRFDAEGTARVNGQTLKFYHFTKLGPIGDTMTRRYAGDNSEVFELWWWYRRQVQANFDPRVGKPWWHYAWFDNGEKISKEIRVLYRSRLDLQQAFPHPFKTGKGSFREWLQTEGKFA